MRENGKPAHAMRAPSSFPWLSPSNCVTNTDDLTPMTRSARIVGHGRAALGRMAVVGQSAGAPARLIGLYTAEIIRQRGPSTCSHNCPVGFGNRQLPQHPHRAQRRSDAQSPEMVPTTNTAAASNQPTIHRNRASCRQSVSRAARPISCRCSTRWVGVPGGGGNWVYRMVLRWGGRTGFDDSIVENVIIGH